MKHILLYLLIISMLSLPSMGQAGFARAEEFGAPRLNMSPPQYLTPSPMRDWHPGGEPPIHAELLRIKGEWGNSALAVLRTPMGRIVTIPMRALSDDDIQAAEQWMKQNNFITIRTYKRGTHIIKPLTIIPLNIMRFGWYRVRFCKPDGNIYCWATNNGEVFPVELRNSTTGPYYMPREYSKLLTEVEQRQKPQAGVPLLIAENIQEAMAYSAMHGLCVTTIYLGTRGSMADVVFRHYLKTHPHAGYHWSMRHVFLLVYSDAEGLLPPETIRELTTIEMLHSNHRNNLPASGLEDSVDQLIFQRLHSQNPNEIRGHSYRPDNYDSAYFSGGWSHRPDEFLKLPAKDISFGVQ